MPEDSYSELDYVRVIDWPKRLEREWALFGPLFGAAPSRRLLDLGCGPGKHARFLASRGFEVVGVDASQRMLDVARADPLPPGVDFVLGDISRVGELVTGPFGGAICLGNTLPHVRDLTSLERLATGVRERLVPGAPWLMQILNYERIFNTQQRYLPPSFTREGEDEIIFFRVMTPQSDGEVVFSPCVLRYSSAGEPALQVVTSRNVRLRGWRHHELTSVLKGAGFANLETYGSYTGAPFVPLESSDLIVVAR
jgi:glycine/sarcosine N-methyltransferase